MGPSIGLLTRSEVTDPTEGFQALRRTKRLSSAATWTKQTLSRRFAGSNSSHFCSSYKTKIETENLEFIEKAKKENDFKPVSLAELRKHIKNIKSKSAPGKDGILPVMLKHMPDEFCKHVLHLFNMSLKEGKVPDAWKESRITMLPKKPPASDPNNYRPISLLSCLGKLLERIVAQRISHFLHEHGITIKQQSGFRCARRTTDNLSFQLQKMKEAFSGKNKSGKNILTLLFDIQAAFDAVWHAGLVNKLFKIKVPGYLVLWIIDFLKDRKFDVKVGGSVSALTAIGTGVPQGSPASPILFSIFINDMPMRFSQDNGYTLLFADDLTAFFFFDKVTLANESITVRVTQYLEEIEQWLCKWRLLMAPSKCSYTVFSKKNSCRTRFGLKLFGGEIPYEKNPVSLGITFDECLNFEAHVSKLKDRCASRLNIVRILSHKSWKLEKKTLVSLYTTLIGSVLDYSSFICSALSTPLIKTIQAVQNAAVRAIFRIPAYNKVTEHHSTTEELRTVSNLQNVNERMSDLNRRYLLNAKATGNPLIAEAVLGYFEKFGEGVRPEIETFLCEHIDLFLK